MSGLVFNQDPHLAEIPAAPAEPARFHRSLPRYRPTPLRTLPRVAGELGLAEVLLKDESGRLGLTSFKALGASWAIEHARRTQPGTKTLVAASAGNHGLAVAHSGAAIGMDCLIFLPAATAPGRAERIAATGARPVRVDGDYDAAIAAAAQAARADGAVLIADMSEDPDAPSPRWVVDGYSTLFAELSEQLPGSPDLVLVPAGVGSLTAAAVIWAAHQPGPPHVLAVEPATAACVAAALTAGRPVRIPTPGTTMSGLDCGTASAVAWPVLRAGLTGAVQVTDEPVHQAMRDLAGCGLAIGDCGAAPLAALRALLTEPDHQPARDQLCLGPTTRVLLLATEGITDPASYRAVVPA
jgi:diaminopropionate ammonia-lyase